MEEKDKIINYNKDCNVFNGPLYKPVIAPPNSHDARPIVREEAFAEFEEVMEDNTPMDPPCFRFTNEFTRLQVAAAVKLFYHGEHSDLALIEVTLYDHGLLKKRNSHTSFVKSLVAWGLINAEAEQQKQIVSGIKDKYKRLPKEGYKDWSNICLNDKNRCIEIGKHLDPTMKYQR